MKISQFPIALSALALAVCLTGCASFGSILPSAKSPRHTLHKELYENARPEETSITVSLLEQRASLLGKNGEILLETDISSGADGFETPPGNYKILEKLPTKFSNRFGRYVVPETGKIVVAKAWQHKGPPPLGTTYQGIEMPLWMRLTWDGVGMHVGKFDRRVRSSGGCIRVPIEAQNLLYPKTCVGTQVKVAP